MKILKYTLLVLFSLLISNLFALDENCFPKKSNRLVTDLVGILNTEQQNALEAKLVHFARKTSTQIAIVIVDNLCDYDKADYTYTLAEKWGVGQKGKENGILMMVKPTGGAGERQTFIATGYGLEGAVPDATARRIVEQEMIPHFKNNDIYGGLVAATDVIIKLTEGEFTADQYGKSDGAGYLGLILILVLFLIIFFGKYSSAKSYARKNNMGLWAALMLMSATSNSRSGSYGGFSSGSGSFGGGGSSFGGFGGGSFGGGGAGGSW